MNKNYSFRKSVFFFIVMMIGFAIIYFDGLYGQFYPGALIIKRLITIVRNANCPEWFAFVLWLTPVTLGILGMFAYGKRR